MKRELLGKVGVDAGMLMVGDPCYFIGKEAAVNQTFPDWKTACEKLFCNSEHQDADSYKIGSGLGIAVQTTYGDGSYDVFLETDDDGDRRLIVELQ